MANGKSFCRRSFLLAISALLGRASGALGQDLPQPPIRMAVNGNYPPLSFRGPEGAFSGILIDIFNHVGAETGLHFDYNDLPWARAQQMVRAGHLDGLCTISTAERRSYLEFAPAPVVEEPTVIVYRAGDARAEMVEVPDDLRGLRFGEPLGSGWFKEILPEAEVEWTADIDNLLGMIAAGRIDATLLGLWTAHARLTPDSKLAYRILPGVPGNGAFRFGLRKSFPRCQEIVARVDAAIKALRGTGTIDEVVRHYIP
ncbi:MAG TPA: transporter substrate-binding domain-containing protein [Magnetospirillaceae bacterium]|nr:transporter substrate-binding domain-containing protein [Magnetospirillaceae bacterium]